MKNFITLQNFSKQNMPNGFENHINIHIDSISYFHSYRYCDELSYPETKKTLIILNGMEPNQNIIAEYSVKEIEKMIEDAQNGNII